MGSLTFIAGTDTDVGKTFVSSLLAAAILKRGLPVGVYKPVASGCWSDQDELVSGDAVALWQAAGKPLDLEHVCPQRFAAAISPPRAAEAEGKLVDVDRILAGLSPWTEGFDHVLIEGAGGLLSPLADDFLNADLAGELEADVILVAANRLGVVNHTLLSVEVCRSRLGRDPIAIVLNQVGREGCESMKTNRGEIQRYVGRMPIIEVGFEQQSLLESAGAEEFIGRTLRTPSA
ncbi:dethiobiotin synthase [Rosistilla oblonga]|uniref:dethiobiotin synthase n=1 Tax=Rosistilla oblonga TaxID=2527990 RepID=UPI003A970251